MSLNRFEQTMFDYWETHPEERRHWQTRVSDDARGRTMEPGDTARNLERELWEYFIERSQYVPLFRDLNSGGIRRISLLNLADYLLRLWGPPPKPKKPLGPPL